MSIDWTSNPEFSKWAFGENYFNMSTLEKMYVWNKRHGNLLMIHPLDEIHLNLCKMRALWVEHCQKEESSVDNPPI